MLRSGFGVCSATGASTNSSSAVNMRAATTSSNFYCPAAKLAVELDGGGHGFPDQRAKDEKRNRFLTGRDIKVLRFWNRQLQGEMEAVRFEIWYALMQRTGRNEEISDYLAKPDASPQPFSAGG
jgi:hypothetical protein